MQTDDIPSQFPKVKGISWWEGQLHTQNWSYRDVWSPQNAQVLLNYCTLPWRLGLGFLPMPTVPINWPSLQNLVGLRPTSGHTAALPTDLHRLPHTTSLLHWPTSQAAWTTSAQHSQVTSRAQDKRSKSWDTGWHTSFPSLDWAEAHSRLT